MKLVYCFSSWRRRIVFPIQPASNSKKNQSPSSCRVPTHMINRLLALARARAYDLQNMWKSKKRGIDELPVHAAKIHANVRKLHAVFV